MTFFFAFQFLGGGPKPLGPPPLDTRLCLHYIKLTVKMDADLCLGDNLILLDVLQKHQTFKVNLQLPIVISKKIIIYYARKKLPDPPIINTV